MKLIIRSLLSLALVAGITESAHAAFPAGFGGQTYCGGNSFQTCAWFSASITAGGVVTLTVENTSGNSGSFFTAIGLANLGAGATASNFSFNPITGTTDWDLGTPPNGLSGAGIVGPVIGGYRTGDPSVIESSLRNGEKVVFTFTLGGTYSLDNVQFALHDQGGGPGGECAASTKLVVSQTTPTSGTWEANDPTCGTVVPEPGSMVLLATGLVGLMGAGLVKRRKIN